MTKVVASNIPTRSFLSINHCAIVTPWRHILNNFPPFHITCKQQRVDISLKQDGYKTFSPLAPPTGTFFHALSNTSERADHIVETKVAQVSNIGGNAKKGADAVKVAMF